MIKAIIFDMAGTTINENNVVYKTIQSSFIQHGIECSLDEVIEFGAGKEKQQAITDVYFNIFEKEIENEDLIAIYDTFKTQLNLAYEHHEVFLMDGYAELATFLKSNDIFIVFNTGYQSDVAQLLLKKVNISENKEIDILVTADMVANGRPNPDMIIYALEKLMVKPQEAVKVGDTVIDLEEGQRAGLKYSIAVTTGAMHYDQLQAGKPDFILSHLSELIPIVIKENKLAEYDQ